MNLARSFGALGAIALLVAATACSPAATPSPTAAPAKPAAASSPSVTGGAPAASPAAKPAASPAASPAAAASAPSAPAAAPQTVAKPGDFPNKPIEIIVPFAAGGGYDVVARQLAQPLQTLVGQPVVVKNVVGGGQRIGARTFQQAPADGYTIGYFADSTLYPATLVEPPEGFDLDKWTWVAGLRKSPVYIGVGKDSTIKNIQDLLEADKAGRRLRFGHGGIGNFLPTQVAFAETVGLKNAAYVGGFTWTADMAPALVRRCRWAWNVSSSWITTCTTATARNGFFTKIHASCTSPRIISFYPGTGAAADVGRGNGAGFTLNVPLEAGSTDGDYSEVFKALVIPVIDQFRPSLVLISAGYDAHERDPLARMRLSTSGYAALTKSLCDIADAHCHGRIVAVTEGGYDLSALKACLESSISVLDGAPVAQPKEPLPPTDRSRMAIAAVRSAHKNYWKL